MTGRCGWLNPRRGWVRLFPLAAVISLALAGAPGEEMEAAAEPARRAFDLRMAGKVDEALQVLEAALRDDPADAEVRFELSRCQFSRMEFGKAREAARRALEAKPQDARRLYWAGLVEGYDGIHKVHNPLTWPLVPRRFRQSRDLLEQSLDLEPGAREARLRLVELLHGLPWVLGGSRSRAEEHARMLESLDEVEGARARSLLLPANDPAGRLRLWEGIVARHEESARAHLHLGIACRDAGDSVRSAEHLERALDLASPGDEVLTSLARIWFDARLYDRAEQAVRRYMDLDPADFAPIRAYGLFGLSRLEKARGNAARAEELRAEAANVDPRYWPTMMPPPRELFIAP